jgi:uncharacterized Zn finger protein
MVPMLDVLIKTLYEAGEHDRARKWCVHGYQKTIEDAPGIASGLQTWLRKIAEADGRLDLAAAYWAEEFFERPSEHAYIDLRTAAIKIKVWPAVRIAVLDYLQTGQRPAASGKGEVAWPLPEPDVKKPISKDKFRKFSFPNREMQIEIAIIEQCHDDAVAIYRELDKPIHWSWDIDVKLARFVASSHPEVALNIWQSIVEHLISQVKPKAYLSAAPYLRQMNKGYEQTGRIGEWKALLLNLRTQHKAKRRLMEVLDGLENNRKLIG